MRDFLTSGSYLSFALSMVIAVGGSWVLFEQLRRSQKAYNNRDSSRDDGRYLTASLLVIIFIFFTTFTFHYGILWTWAIFGADTRYEDLLNRAINDPNDKVRKSAHLEIHDLLNQIEPLLSETDADTLRGVHGKKSLDVFADLVRDDFNATRSILEDRSFGQRIQKYVRFLSPSADTARVVYETRNILGYAGAITVTCVTFFVPILLWLWSRAKQRVEERLFRLIGYRSITTVDQAELNKQIVFERSVLEQIVLLGHDFWWPFIITFLCMVGLLLGLALVNFCQLTPIQVYVWAVWLLTASIMLSLWLVLLLVTYEIRVQPYVRDHSSLFAMEKFTRRKVSL
jgi:hypothetical protein